MRMPVLRADCAPEIDLLTLIRPCALSTGAGRPTWNLVISNVPGPNFPLYLAGSKMLHWYPVSFVNDGSGLNITVHSYNGMIDIGLLSCRELVPELWSVMDYLSEAADELMAAAVT